MFHSRTATRMMLMAAMALAAGAIGTGSAHAAVVTYGSNVSESEFTGSRSVGDGLTQSDVSAHPDATISWEIDFLDGENVFQYTYIFSDFGNQMAPSHLTIDISDNGLDGNSQADADAFFAASMTDNDDPLTPNLQFNEGAFPDGIIGGVKFDTAFSGQDTIEGEGGGTVVTFKSNRVPVWHNMVVKTGGGASAMVANDGFLEDFLNDSTLTTNAFIPTPNAHVIPTPAALPAGLAGLAWVAYRRRRRAK